MSARPSEPNQQIMEGVKKITLSELWPTVTDELSMGEIRRILPVVKPAAGPGLKLTLHADHADLETDRGQVMDPGSKASAWVEEASIDGGVFGMTFYQGKTNREELRLIKGEDDWYHICPYLVREEPHFFKCDQLPTLLSFICKVYSLKDTAPISPMYQKFKTSIFLRSIK